MSCHNKWSKIKNQKESTDRVKGRLYSFHSKRISQAVKEGKGIEQAINLAKNASVPREVIDRALERGKKHATGKENIYEALFLGGKIGILIKTLTDNANRTAGELHSILEKNGAKMGSVGSASYMFSKKGEIEVPKSPSNLDLIFESDAEDYEENEEDISIWCEVQDLEKIAEFFKNKNVEASSKEIIYKAENPIEISEEETEKLESLIEKIESVDEVENVWTNAV